MASRVDLPLAVNKVYEVQWTQRTGKWSKIDFPEPEIPMVAI